MSFTIREATSDDIPALARLHVKTFNQTHTFLGIGGPSYELRASQYRALFAKTDGSWFCFVAADADGELVGFAVGEPSDDEHYRGELSKLYLLREYQRRGVGTKLACHVAQRFVSQGITSMQLFSQAENKSLGFFDAMGGEKWLGDAGEFHGGYRWRDIHALAGRCADE
ncbi:MAG TPA: GNAT family N-acetyltransferase [Gemmatimonadaceae bacterium]|nr:GNAT family N-acetyltransferase [Gemmatimonadaceae bacterium]